MKSLFAVHYALALSSLAALLIVVRVSKGTPRHAYWGKIYLWLASSAFISGIAVLYFKHPTLAGLNRFFLLKVFAAYLTGVLGLQCALLGWLTLDARRWTPFSLITYFCLLFSSVTIVTLEIFAKIWPEPIVYSIAMITIVNFPLLFRNRVLRPYLHIFYMVHSGIFCIRPVLSGAGAKIMPLSYQSLLENPNNAALFGSLPFFFGWIILAIIFRSRPLKFRPLQ